MNNERFKNDEVTFAMVSVRRKRLLRTKRYYSVRDKQEKNKMFGLYATGKKFNIL